MSKLPNSGRIWLVFVGLTFVGMGVFGRIVYIQTVEHDKWQARGEQFSTSVRTIEPARGQILADDGSLLATSVPVYDLRWDSKCEGMRWDDYHNTVDTLCQLLGKATDKSSVGIRRKFDNARQRGHRGALIARNIPFTAYKKLRELPFVKLGRYKSGLVFERRENRRRPFGKLAARTVGIDREQQRVGIERAWNEELSGVEGQQLSRKVAGNQWMPVTDDYLVDPVEGLDVVTTLNLHLQDVATTALERQLRKHDAAWGTVIGTAFELVIPLVIFLSSRFAREFGTRAAWRVSKRHIADIFRIGWPGALMFANEMACWTYLMVALIPKAADAAGQSPVLANTAGWIGLRYMHLSFMPTVGLSIAITAIVGKCMGMNRPELAASRTWLAFRLGLAYMGLCGVGFFIFREPLVDLFVSNDTSQADREQIILRTKAFAQEVYRVSFSPRFEGQLTTGGMAHSARAPPPSARARWNAREGLLTSVLR